MPTARLTGLLLLGLAVAGCDRLPGSGSARQQAQPAPAQARATPTPAQAPTTPAQQDTQVPGATPMAERVAVLGVLNKRNGISRDIRIRPGQAARGSDVIVRLGACETTPPWEFDKLTGAFVQVEVQQPGGQWRRVFSGWLYKESPSLNVVEHPVYDVWVKSCAMTFPEGPSAPARPRADNSSSSAANSAAGSSRRTASRPAPRAAASNAE